jgi:hypothetical protein
MNRISHKASAFAWLPPSLQLPTSPRLRWASWRDKSARQAGVRLTKCKPRARSKFCVYRDVNVKRERKRAKKTAFSLGILIGGEVNEKGWLHRGVETGNGIGNWAANYANLRKYLTTEILNRKDLIEHKASATPAIFFNHGWTRTGTDWGRCYTLSDACQTRVYTFFLCGLHGEETNTKKRSIGLILLGILNFWLRKRARRVQDRNCTNSREFSTTDGHGPARIRAGATA